MKPTLFPTIAAALLLAISASYAADKPDAAKFSTDATKPQVQQPAKRIKAKAKAPKQERITLTGSYIKQKVTKNGVIVSGLASPLIVLDSDTIRRTGAADIPDLFRRGGWAH